MDYPATPQLTDHARERCAEMGIRTRVVKQIWRTRTLTYVMFDQPGKIRVTSDKHPEYALIVDEEGERPVIITVLFASDQSYVRAGRTFRVKS